MRRSVGMRGMDPVSSLPLVLVVSSVLTVLAALLLAAAVERALANRSDRRGTAWSPAVFLIADDTVLDANERGLALLTTLARQDPGPEAAGRSGPAASWQRLWRHLAPRFPDLAARMAGEGRPSDGWRLSAGDGSGLILAAAPVGGALRLTLDRDLGLAPDEGAVRVDPLSWQALTDELEVLRRTTDAGPVPTWRQSADGRIVWANGAYLRLLAEVGQTEAMGWPLPALFPTEGSAGRHAVTAAVTGRQVWFDLVAIDEGANLLVFALPADEAQRAERARRDFVQTLTKTFATLPIGLAVFDRTRRLQLFNPALADLTGLEPEFLASRPGLEGVLNRMRDKHVMPEPRDYRAWTRRLLDVEAVATGSGFEETWALPDGRTFRVSAAPHPDGALALLIEDVTSDIRLKRSYRAEVDVGRAALDMVDEAVAVFDAAGALLLTNAAFDQTWVLEGADTLAGVQFGEAIANWREAGGEPAFWDRVAALSSPGAPGTEVRGLMRLADGETFIIRARRAPGGGVMIGFSGSAMRSATPSRPEPPRMRRATG
jgi:PAS domain-containing protein